MSKIKIYTIDPDTDGFENLESLTYNDVIEMGEHQTTSHDFQSSLEVLVYLLNEQRINTECFIVVVNEETREIVSHQNS